MKIAVIGASGLVGRKIIELLQKQENYNDYKIIPYCSKKSAGKTINNLTLQELCDKAFQKVDVALFSAGSEVSKLWAKKFAESGAYVLDNSNAFRREEEVPLVVPEINSNQINLNSKIIANPNCSTIQIALPLFYLNNVIKIKKVIVSTYQSVSGAGKKGLEDLENNTSFKFSYPITNNLIPQIDIALDTGYTLEEDKINFELKKILSLPDLSVTATAVRVPIKNCHGASVYVEFENEFDVSKAKEILSQSKGIILQDNLANNLYPMPLTSTDKDEVFVGRLRQDLGNKKAINFWVVSDNLRKGAALNAVQIMKIIETTIKKEAKLK